MVSGMIFMVFLMFGSVKDLRLRLSRIEESVEELRIEVSLIKNLIKDLSRVLASEGYMSRRDEDYLSYEFRFADLVVLLNAILDELSFIKREGFLEPINRLRSLS